MAKVKKEFKPNEKQLEYARFSINIGIVLCMHPIQGMANSFWIEKYKLDDYKNTEFLREDLNKPKSVKNRKIFNEYDAWEKIFELYKIVYDKNN